MAPEHRKRLFKVLKAFFSNNRHQTTSVHAFVFLWSDVFIPQRGKDYDWVFVKKKKTKKKKQKKKNKDNIM